MGYTRNYVWSRISKILCPAYLIVCPQFVLIVCPHCPYCQAASWQNCTLHTEHGNCCCPHCRCHHLGYSVPPAHHRTIIVPFGAEAPSGHLAQAWAIPPSSWGLLSQWHRQQTTTPETNKALRDFTLYMTTIYAILRRMCLNYINCLTHSWLLPPMRVH